MRLREKGGFIPQGGANDLMETGPYYFYSPGNKSQPFHHFRRQTSVNIANQPGGKTRQPVELGKQAEWRACLSQACCPVVHPEVTSPDWLRPLSSTSQLGASVQPMVLFHRGRCSASFDSEILGIPKVLSTQLSLDTPLQFPPLLARLCKRSFLSKKQKKNKTQLERPWNESQI